MLCLLITMLDKEESPCAVLANYNVRQGRVCAVLANYNVKQGRVTMCCAC